MAVLLRPTASQKSRLRLIVVQVLVLSLFVTLFARLWYLQVASGEHYQAQAASQSVRDVVVQPARGLIVDDMGRPLVANRSTWVVSVDRTLLGKLSSARRTSMLHSLARVVKAKYADIVARTLVCGDPGSVSGTCWNGSPYQPVPVARDVPQGVAVKLLEQSEDFPAVLAQQDSVRAYPSPYGVNAAAAARLPQPGHRRASSTRPRRTATPRSTAPRVVGRAGVEKAYDPYLRGQPGYTKVAVDSMGRVLGDSGTVASQPGDTLVTSIDASVQSDVEKQLHDAITTARATYDKVTHRNYIADSGAAIVMEAKTGRIVAMASQPTYNPDIWSGGITEKQLKSLYSAKSDDPLLSRATQGQYAPGSTWKPFMTIGALNNGFSQNTLLNCSSGVQVGNRLFKNYESESYGDITFAKALAVSCDTFFYRVGLQFWNQYGSDPANVERQGPPGRRGEELRLRQRPRRRRHRCLQRPGRRPPLEAVVLEGDEGLLLPHRPQEHRPAQQDFLHVFAHEFCLEGYYYRAGDAVNFAIGQGDTLVTPLQLARAYAALSNGGTLDAARLAKAIVCPSGKVIRRIQPEGAVRRIDPAKSALAYVDNALKAPRRRARWPGSSSGSRSTRCSCAARPAPPRSTASRAPRGWPPTTRTTSW